MQPLRPKDRHRILARDPQAQPRIDEFERRLSERFVNPKEEIWSRASAGSSGSEPLAAPENLGARLKRKLRELHEALYGAPVAQDPSQPRFGEDEAKIEAEVKS